MGELSWVIIVIFTTFMGGHEKILAFMPDEAVRYETEQKCRESMTTVMDDFTKLIEQGQYHHGDFSVQCISIPGSRGEPT